MTKAPRRNKLFSGEFMYGIEINTSRKYEVYIGEGLLAKTGEMASELLSGKRALIVAGENVLPIYGQKLAQSLKSAGFDVNVCHIPSGEQNKNVDTLLSILNTMAELELDRDDAVFALGGGVTGDIAGLAAALYRRGIACVQLPTTLLAAVDSSVGGKTAINLNKGKNLMGVFAQPALVVCDTSCLSTLSPRVFNEGWAEIIKYACIADPNLAEADDMERIIARCIEIKRDAVVMDEHDRGQRRLLNFGHTIGHAVEKASGFSYLHGEAVAIGMAVLARGCAALGLCEADCPEKIEQLLRLHELPTGTELPAEEIFAAARSDKKRSGESIALVLPSSFGCCKVVNSSFELLRQIIEAGL